MTTNSKSKLFAHRIWLIASLVPFLVFFAVGAAVGWWLIDKDSGKYRASFSQEEPLSDYLYPTLITGLVFGSVGAGLGLAGYGCYRFMRKSETEKR